MEIIIAVALIAAGWWWLQSKSSRNRQSSAASGPSKQSSTSTSQPKGGADLRRLQQYWQAVAAGHHSVPGWYHDPATERQLARLKEEGVKSPVASLTKGQASDLIGLSCEPEDSDLAVLKFFKVPKSEVENQTWARVRAATLLVDSAKREQWENRPATQIQKEFYRWFGHKVPEALSCRDAERLIAAQYLGDDQLDEWHAYEAILEEFEDRDFRDDEGIKKVPVSTIRQAVLAIQAKGKRVADLNASDVVPKVLELKPELHKG